jgi:putative tryptophan/tyrosine transport system substrate-binding protein
LMAGSEDDPTFQARIAAFRQGLAGLGWAVGRDLQLEYRWAGGDTDRMRAYAGELVGLAPDLVIANSSPALAALKGATSSIPIVFVIVNDPVGQGFISSMAHPGGNITGFTFFEYPTLGKLLQLLKEMAPRVNHVGMMYSPDTNPFYTGFLRSFATAARALGVELQEALVRTQADIDTVVARFASLPDSAFMVPPDAFTVVQRGLIIRAVAHHRLPAIFSYRQLVAEGALMGYGPDTNDIFHRSASYVDRILRGANPADLPAQAPIKFEFGINLKTARALGLNVPDKLLALADEVIE